MIYKEDWNNTNRLLQPKKIIISTLIFPPSFQQKCPEHALRWKQLIWHWIHRMNQECAGLILTAMTAKDPSTSTATWRPVKTEHFEFKIPFFFKCPFKGITYVSHDAESTIDVAKCSEPGCYSRAINYGDTTINQMSVLAQLSGECHQSITVTTTLFLNPSLHLFDSFFSIIYAFTFLKSTTALMRRCISTVSTSPGGTTDMVTLNTFGRVIKLTLTSANVASMVIASNLQCRATATLFCQHFQMIPV